MKQPKMLHLEATRLLPRQAPAQCYQNHLGLMRLVLAVGEQN